MGERLLHGVFQTIRKTFGHSSSFAYGLALPSLEQFIDDKLFHGRARCSGEEALAAPDLKPEALAAATTRLEKKRR